MIQLPRSADQADAAEITLGLPVATCAPDGAATVYFAWTPIEGASATYIDLSLNDNGFVPGTYISGGPFEGNAGSLAWPGILASQPHFWRVAAQVGNGFVYSSAGSFNACGVPTILTPGVQCTSTTTMAVTFRWSLLTAAGGWSWLDLGYDPTFAQDTYTGISLDPSISTYTWQNLDGNAPWYARVTRVTADGYWYVTPSLPVSGGCTRLQAGIHSSNDRLVVARLGIDAPVNTQDVGADAKMGVPLGHDDVLRYNFPLFEGYGGYPGNGGSTLISGHVDYYQYGLAVFAPLRDVAYGDVIEYHRGDGIVVYYAVDWYADLPPNTDWNALAINTATDSIALITCNGEFNFETRSYDHRRVVHASILNNG